LAYENEESASSERGICYLLGLNFAFESG